MLQNRLISAFCVATGLGEPLISKEEQHLPELTEVKERMNGLQFDHLWER